MTMHKARRELIDLANTAQTALEDLADALQAYAVASASEGAELTRSAEHSLLSAWSSLKITGATLRRIESMGRHPSSRTNRGTK